MLFCDKKNLGHRGEFRVGFVKHFKLERNGGATERHSPLASFSSAFTLFYWPSCLSVK